MTKFEEQMAKYKEAINKYSIDVPLQLVESAAAALGPSIYKSDSNGVACSQKSEKDYVVEKFLKKKLGLSEDDATLMKAVDEVCEKMGSKNPIKYRPIFYALLAKKFSKESVYNA